MKSKTLATWLAFVGGPLGLHRFYLHGLARLAGLAAARCRRSRAPTACCACGRSARTTRLSWVLIPLRGVTFAACCLTAIVYGLMTPDRWNARFNPQADPEAPAGQTSWATIWAIVASLMIGTGVLMASIAFSFQRYFEYQVEEGRKISR